jgi:hypothetical protein
MVSVFEFVDQDIDKEFTTNPDYRPYNCFDGVVGKGWEIEVGKDERSS